MIRILRRRPPSEREIAEKKLKKSRIPELHPRPGYEGQAARYIVKHPSGRPEMDRWATGRVIRAGVSPAEFARRQDEEENRFMREDSRTRAFGGERPVVHGERTRPEPERARRRVR